MTTPTAPIPTTDRNPYASSSSPPVAAPHASRHRRGHGAVWLLLAVGLAAGCASSPAEQPAASSTQVAPVVAARPLEEHIPAVGMRWLVQLRPKALMSHPRFSKDWTPVFAQDRILAFTQASGADPRKIEVAFIAGYDLGELYLFDGREIGAAAQKAFEARALSTRELKTDFANVKHITGIIEQTPHALVHVEGHLVAIAVGDIQLARIVRAYAEGKLRKTKTAFEDRYLALYESFHPNALVRAFLRGPYENSTDAVAAGFVTGASAVSFQDDELRVHARALGAWPYDARLQERLTKYVDQLLSTRELRALGWGFPSVAPEVSCEETAEGLALCGAEGAWISGAVADALRRITAGSLAEIVDGAPPGWHPEATTVPPDGETSPPEDPSGGTDE